MMMMRKRHARTSVYIYQKCFLLALILLFCDIDTSLGGKRNSHFLCNIIRHKDTRFEKQNINLGNIVIVIVFSFLCVQNVKRFLLLQLMYLFHFEHSKTSNIKYSVFFLMFLCVPNMKQLPSLIIIVF